MTLADTYSTDPIPREAAVLGALGLVPFGLAAAGVVLWPAGSPAELAAAKALLGYGAAILSFLGGVRWGNALRITDAHAREHEFALAVLPALAGWFALLVPFFWAASLFTAAFAIQGLWDVGAAHRGELPAWYGRLRKRLTIVVTGILALVAGYAAVTL